MKTSQHPGSEHDPAPPSAEARSAFDEIVSDVVAGPLSDVLGELQVLADEFREADEEALKQLKRSTSTSRTLADYIGEPGVGSSATLFGLIGDPEDPADGTLASQLARIHHVIGDTAAAGSQDHERLEALIREAVDRMAAHHEALRTLLGGQRDALEASTTRLVGEVSTAHADVRDLRSAQSQKLDQLRTQQQDSAQAIEAIAEAAGSIRRDLSTAAADITSAAQEQRNLALQRADAVSTRINLLTILVILQGAGLTALMLVR
ncbi:MAG: hypothetical protein WCF04_09690 [Candidatus Nanopelagicales bacterium]